MDQTTHCGKITASGRILQPQSFCSQFGATDESADNAPYSCVLSRELVHCDPATFFLPMCWYSHDPWTFISWSLPSLLLTHQYPLMSPSRGDILLWFQRFWKMPSFELSNSVFFSGDSNVSSTQIPPQSHRVQKNHLHLQLFSIYIYAYETPYLRHHGSAFPHLELRNVFPHEKSRWSLWAQWGAICALVNEPIKRIVYPIMKEQRQDN